MSTARQHLIAALARVPGAPLTAVDHAEQLADAHRAAVLIEDGQAYDGELAMLRGLVATLVAVAEHGDLTDVRQLLAEYQRDDREARKMASPMGAAASRAGRTRP
ncbi:hypothetical protein [Streptomyces sp. SID8352]|uniref:hypothetical protein n=1 Tax=Streptomyces sp. SID8352 TaxID=2690338 RepID=UPI00136C0269|nr:hypothetical protein [Streptomyces sp. SID8352]MYU22904.1 hypothetical protein [Streptomyces sp. SID8352]